MNLKYRHIIGISLLLCGLLGFVACTNDAIDPPHEEEDDYKVFLTFQAAVAGVSTRADGSVADDGRVETLRIVIVSRENEDGAAWKVEHNNRVPLTTQLPHEYTFKVAPNSLKRIYLIANEAGLTDPDGALLDFSDGQFLPDAADKAAVDDYVFDVSTFDYSYTPSALPMTGLYEFEVPTIEDIQNGDFRWPNPLYLVRAATKFTFEFKKESTDRLIAVTGIDIQRVITDRMYLMPHVNKNSEGLYWVVEETKTETGDDVTYTEKTVEDWLVWMGEEAEESKTGADNEWLTDYEVPTSATDESHSITFDAPITVPETGVVNIPKVIYLPESKTVKTPDDGYLLQEYSITVHTLEHGETGEQAYTAILPHLASLFRNTHVEVGGVFASKGNAITLDCEVDVIPYSEVVLDPGFGIDTEEKEN